LINSVQKKYKTAAAIDSSRAALSYPVQGTKGCKVRQHIPPAKGRGQRQYAQGGTSKEKRTAAACTGCHQQGEEEDGTSKENQKSQTATKKRPVAGWKRPLGVSGSKRLER